MYNQELGSPGLVCFTGSCYHDLILGTQGSRVPHLVTIENDDVVQSWVEQRLMHLRSPDTG